MRLVSVVACLAGVVLGLVALAQGAGGEFPNSRGVEIHEACTREGVHVETVRESPRGTYEVVCPQAEHAKAMEILRAVLATPAPGQTPVKTLQDALVVLRFEPQSRVAIGLVKKHYETLRQKHLDSLKKKR